MFQCSIKQKLQQWSTKFSSAWCAICVYGSKKHQKGQYFVRLFVIPSSFFTDCLFEQTVSNCAEIQIFTVLFSPEALKTFSGKHKNLYLSILLATDHPIWGSLLPATCWIFTPAFKSQFKIKITFFFIFLDGILNSYQQFLVVQVWENRKCFL